MEVEELKLRRQQVSPGEQGGAISLAMYGLFFACVFNGLWDWS